uniref:hypothetical protein n=1 Tax=uncultured Caulobacter sp. TaxID=158749 RepID=UPI0025DE0662|nr:hypothetical protein [uncultured Caulobacter sp.]
MAASIYAQVAWLVPYIATNMPPPRSACAFAEKGKHVNSTSSNLSLSLNIDAANVAVPLTEADQTALRELQNRAEAVAKQEGRAVSARALLLRRQDAFVRQLGVVSLTQHAKDIGFAYVATSLVFHLVAQLLLNIDIEKADEADKERLRAEVAMLARALADLDARKGEHVHLTDEEFVAWYGKQGRISGLAGHYLSLRKMKRAKSGGQPEVMASDEQVEAIFANPAAVAIDTLAGIPTGQEGAFLYRQEGDKICLIPLLAPRATIIELAGFAPSPLANAPKDLLFNRQMLLAGVSLVTDEDDSGLTVEKVPEGDVPNDTYDKLPANGVYLVERGHISIAHARRDDGLIVQVEPLGVDPGYALADDKYLDNLTRRRLGKALIGEANAAQFAASAVDGVAAKISGSGASLKLTFTNKATGEKVNLIIKPREMGSIWTYRVSPSFSPAGQAVMDEAATVEFDKTFLKALLKKQVERVVTVAIGEAGMRFANGKAAPLTCAAVTNGAATAQVLSSDLKRALVGLLGLPITGGLVWKLDPNGLLAVEASSDVARFRVFIQTLEANREQPTRERKLRERVESLPRASATDAHAA